MFNVAPSLINQYKKTKCSWKLMFFLLSLTFNISSIITLSINVFVKSLQKNTVKICSFKTQYVRYLLEVNFKVNFYTNNVWKV